MNDERQSSRRALALTLPPSALRPPPSHGPFPLANRFHLTLGSAFFRAFVGLRVRGAEHLPGAGEPWLLAANHLSHFDPALLTTAAGRWVDWAAMVELYRGPVARWFWNGLAAFPVHRGRATDGPAARTALARLRAGRVVGIFPERGIRVGERSVLAHGDDTRLGAGAARLALAAGVPVIPAAIVGSERLYRTGGWGWPFGRNRFRVTVAFGPPLRPTAVEDGGGGGRTPKAVAEELTRRLATELRRLAAVTADQGANSAA